MIEKMPADPIEYINCRLMKEEIAAIVAGEANTPTPPTEQTP